MKKQRTISMCVGLDSPIRTMIKKCKQWKIKNNGKLIAFDPQGIFSREGILDYIISLEDKNWAKKLIKKNKNGKYKFSNSLLILPDYRILNPKDSIQLDFLDLIQHKTEIGIDIIMSTSYPINILERLSFYISNWYIFSVEEEESSFLEKSPSYLKCQNAIEKINKYVSENYIDKYTKTEQPHIIVRHNSDILDLVNMENKPKSTRKIPSL